MAGCCSKGQSVVDSFSIFVTSTSTDKFNSLFAGSGGEWAGSAESAGRPRCVVTGTTSAIDGRTSNTHNGGRRQTVKSTSCPETTKLTEPPSPDHYYNNY